MPPYQLGRDRCQALLAAGLPGGIVAIAADLLAGERIHPVNRAELELYLALGQLARGDADAAIAAARSARNRFRHQGREIATARAELVVLTARRRAGARGAALATTAEELARRLEQARSRTPRLRGCTRDGPRSTYTPSERESCGPRQHGTGAAPSGLVRATAWLAQGLERDRAR